MIALRGYRSIAVQQWGDCFEQVSFEISVLSWFWFRNRTNSFLLF